MTKWWKKLIEAENVRTLDYENNIIEIISMITLVGLSIVNLVYFTTFHIIDYKYTIVNTLILLSFVFFLYVIRNMVKNSLFRSQCSIIHGVVLLTVMFFRYYPIIGPTVWTYSFVIIMIFMLRENLSGIILLALTFFMLGIYGFKSDMTFTIDQYYHVSQFIAFTTLFLVSRMVYSIHLYEGKQLRNKNVVLKRLSDEKMQINQKLIKEINRHKKTLNQLDVSEKRFKAMIHASPDIIFKVNEKGEFLDCEVGSEQLLYRDKQFFIGKRVLEVLPPDVAYQTMEKIEAVIERGSIERFEYILEIQGEFINFEARFVKLNMEEVFIIVRDITELIKHQNEIEYLSFHDQLTGLYNRHYFEAEVKRINTERNMPLSIIMIDVNGLKMTNDAFGHQKGDELLKCVSKLLIQACRSDDIIARMGGDEFVILLPKTSHDEIEKLVARIQTTIEKYIHQEFLVSIAIGYETKISASQPLHDVLIKAEEKMYKMKINNAQRIRKEYIDLIKSYLFEKCPTEKLHSDHVRSLVIQLGRAMNLDKEDIRTIELAAVLHDVGKITLVEELQNCEKEILVFEVSMMKRHLETGYHILKSVDEYIAVAEIVLSHHEFWDGSGYPRGLSGKDIPLGARILRVAEKYDRMTQFSNIPHKEAMAELCEYAGSRYDEKVVEAMKMVSAHK